MARRGRPRKSAKTRNHSKVDASYHPLAIAGLILAFLGPLAIVGIIFCLIALARMPSTGEKGRGIAIAGLIIGAIVLLGTISALIAFFTAAAFISSHVVVGSGTQAAQDYYYTEFSQVQIQGVGDVYLTQAEQFGVRVEADDNVIEHLQIVQLDDVLVIGTDGSIIASPVTVYVSAPLLERLAIKGSGSFHSRNPLVAEKLSISISGAGDVDADLYVKRLSTTITGAGDISLRGNAVQHVIHISGAGDVSAETLRTQTTDIVISGAGSADLNVTQRLDARITGFGDITFWGAPSVTKLISGAGSISAR